MSDNPEPLGNIERPSDTEPLANLEPLIEAARNARLHSVSPFSNFAVGAAVKNSEWQGLHRLQHRECELWFDGLRGTRRDLESPVRIAGR